MVYAAVGIWAVFMIGAAFYCRLVRHPDTKPLASHLIFTTVFSVIGFLLFATGTASLQATGRTQLLDNSLGAVLFLVAVFAPAFLPAREQARKPPKPVTRL